MKNVVIRICNNMLDISNDGRSQLDKETRDIIEAELRYKHYQFLRGFDAYSATTGNYEPMRITTKLLYTYDQYGRLVCGAGFFYRIEKLLKKNGYTIKREEINPVHGRPDRFTIDFDNVLKHMELRNKQDEMLLAIAGRYRGIISATMGFGKTHSFKAIALMFPKAKILVVAKRKDIVQSIRTMLTQTFPGVGQIGGGENKIGNRITVCTAASLHKAPNDVDIILADEGHELASANYIKKLTQFPSARMYCFSATPNLRSDNTSIRLESLFGPIIFNMDFQEAVSRKLVVPIKVRWLNICMADNPCEGMRDVPKLRHGIWRNHHRNSIIADAAREYQDEQVLIMVNTIEHAVYLKSLLPEFTLCYGENNLTDKKRQSYINNGLLTEDEPVMTAARRHMLREQFEKGTLRKAVCTDIWSTGVNFHQLQVLIRADQVSSNIKNAQIPGRCSRLYEGKEYGLLIDCEDMFDKGFHRASKKRRKMYESLGFENTEDDSYLHGKLK